MRAILCHATTGIQELRHADVNPSPLVPHSVRVRMRYAALNPPDALMAQGKYQVQPPLPFVLGVEGMGVVTEVAPEVSEVRAGDRVMVYAGHGCMAEELVVSADRVLAAPKNMPDEVAAGFLLGYGTSHHGLLARGNLKKGETVAVLGAAGSLGTSAIQIAKAVGAYVIAVASTPSKLQFCQVIGADFGILSGSDTLREELKAATDSRGPHVIYDVVGGDLTETLLRAIAPTGRLLIAGYASGKIPAIKANLILLKQAAVIGVSFRQYFQQLPQLAKADLANLIELWATGKLKPPSPEVIEFSQVLDSLNALATGQVTGKIVARVDSTLNG